MQIKQKHLDSVSEYYKHTGKCKINSKLSLEARRKMYKVVIDNFSSRKIWHLGEFYEQILF